MRAKPNFNGTLKFIGILLTCYSTIQIVAAIRFMVCCPRIAAWIVYLSSLRNNDPKIEECSHIQGKRILASRQRPIWRQLINTGFYFAGRERFARLIVHSKFPTRNPLRAPGEPEFQVDIGAQESDSKFSALRIAVDERDLRHILESIGPELTLMLKAREKAPVTLRFQVPSNKGAVQRMMSPCFHAIESAERQAGAGRPLVLMAGKNGGLVRRLGHRLGSYRPTKTEFPGVELDP